MVGDARLRRRSRARHGAGHRIEGHSVPQDRLLAGHRRGASSGAQPPRAASHRMYSMSNVLVPLDGSEKDERAIPAAAAFADLVGGDLRLIRVLDMPMDGLSPHARIMGGADTAVEMRGDIERSVRAIAD